MAHTYGGVLAARASSAANPITAAITVTPVMKVVVVFLKTNGATDRTGGAVTMQGHTFTQASTTQKAATTPEAGCELWYVVNPLPGSYTVSIPNAGTLTIFRSIVAGNPAHGGTSQFDGAAGANATSANPSPGNVTVTTAGDIAFAVAASGITTWAPSAQVGTIIANTDDGAHGSGEQYILNPAIGAHALGWTIGSDDWGAVSAYFKEVAPNQLENYHDPKSVSAGIISIGGIG